MGLRDRFKAEGLRARFAAPVDDPAEVAELSAEQGTDTPKDNSFISPGVDRAISTVADPKTTSGAALQGLQQGVSYGMADEAMGALNSLLEPSKPPTVASGPAVDPAELADLQAEQGTDKTDYQRGRDTARQWTKDAAETHPAAYGAGLVGGAIAAPGPKQTAAKGILPNVTQGLKTGALMGGAAAFGSSDADATKGELGKLLLDTGKGAGLGAALGGAVGVASSKLNPWLEKMAQRRAYKALDPYMNAIKRDTAGKLPEEVMTEMQRLGKRALDEGVIPQGKLDRFATSETLASNAAKLRDQAGVMKGALTDMAQDQLGGRPVSMVRMAKQLQEQAAELMKSPATAPTGRKLSAQADEMLKAAEQRVLAGEGYRMTLPEAEKLKTALQGEANYGIPLAQRGGAAEKAKKLAASMARQSTEDAIERGLGPEELAQFKAAKGRYGDLDKLADTAGYGAARQFRNNLIGLDDKVAALSAPETGNAGFDTFGKWAMAALSKLGKQRGSSGAARTLRNAAESAEATPRMSRAVGQLEPYLKALRDEKDEPQ